MECIGKLLPYSRYDFCPSREKIVLWLSVIFLKPSHCMNRRNSLYLGQEVVDMANEDKKDFNAMLHDSKDMPKFQTITDEKSIEKYGGDKMYFAPPLDYEKVLFELG